MVRQFLWRVVLQAPGSSIRKLFGGFGIIKHSASRPNFSIVLKDWFGFQRGKPILNPKP